MGYLRRCHYARNSRIGLVVLEREIICFESVDGCLCLVIHRKLRLMMVMILASSELAREKMWSRIHLIPMLQAEEDRDLVRRTWADKARERELLGRETKVYNSDRWVFYFLIRGCEIRHGWRSLGLRA